MLVGWGMKTVQGHLKAVLCRFDNNAEYVVNSLLYAYLAGIIVFEVFRRYVLSNASSWGEETAIYAFIWMTYFAAARNVRNRGHLSIDILRRHFNRAGKFALNMLSDLCFFILAIIVIITSIKAVAGSMQFGQTFQGAEIPMWLAIVGVPIGWTLIAFRVIQRSVKSIKIFGRGECEADSTFLSE